MFFDQKWRSHDWFRRNLRICPRLLENLNGRRHDIQHNDTQHKGLVTFSINLLLVSSFFVYLCLFLLASVCFSLPMSVFSSLPLCLFLHASVCFSLSACFVYLSLFCLYPTFLYLFLMSVCFSLPLSAPICFPFSHCFYLFLLASACLSLPMDTFAYLRYFSFSKCAQNAFCNYRQTDRLTDRRMDGWTDRQADGWTGDRWTNG